MVLVDFLGSVALPDNSLERAMNQLACHIFLLSLSGVNVFYYVFVAYPNGTLKKNFLQQLALLGALMQIGSCSCSITRYNIRDEYNYAIGNAGAVFGLASGVFNNIALSTIWVHSDANRAFKWKIIAAIIALISIVALYLEFTTYDETHFFWFRAVNMQNTPYTLITCLFTARALKSKKLRIDPSIIAHDDAVAVFSTLWKFLSVAFLANLTGVTLAIYVGGGLCFGCVNVATHYMGLMDNYYDYGGAGETAPLLPS
mmetsp:Transcript_21937/g.52207  ORF Transcript_21937/g.52207 Transcript_21937/m.52207 type:complete len:257 (-) Transcript_21937:170-940(-)